VPLAPGSPAPSAQVLGADGAAVDLAALAAAGPAVLFFYKGDCGASEAAAHVLPRLAAVPGVAVAVVSQDGDAETRRFAAEHGLGAPVRVLQDPKPWLASRAYDVFATPTWFFLAPGGAVEGVFEGWNRDEANALAARAAALAGAPAPVVSTPADGPAFRPG
jgi:peroxiredoxin